MKKSLAPLLCCISTLYMYANPVLAESLRRRATSAKPTAPRVVKPAARKPQSGNQPSEVAASPKSATKSAAPGAPASPSASTNTPVTTSAPAPVTNAPKFHPVPADYQPTKSIDAAVSVPRSPHGGAGVDPHFSILFDILLAYQPGGAGFSFLNFHPLMLVEIVPTADLMFSFELSPTPRYFELDYQATPSLQLRAGKIWIPFDDLNPHNIFGGRINASRLRLGGSAFLPDIWTDLGVGLKYLLVDNVNFQIESHLYIVNGVNSRSVTGVGNLPNFADIAVTQSDNNFDKALGGRLHLWYQKTFGLGVSYYTARWSGENNTSARTTMLGADLQYRKGPTEFRAGVVQFNVGLEDASAYKRHGSYVEFGQKFGLKREFKALLRAGLTDGDDRATNDDDLAIVGGSLLYQPGLIQWSAEFQQDIKRVAVKAGYTFAGIRAVIQL